MMRRIRVWWVIIMILDYDYDFDFDFNRESMSSVRALRRAYLACWLVFQFFLSMC